MNTDLEVDLGGLFLHNDSYDYEDYTYVDDLESRSAVAVLIPLLFSVVLAVGVPGNLLVLVFLTLKRKCWSFSDIFILHLGLSDVLLLVTLPFWAAQVALPLGWCCGLIWCRINGALFNISFYSGMLLLASIAAERYLSIVHSVQLFKKETPRLPHITCVLIWLVSIFLSIPDWFSLIYIEGKNMNGEEDCSCTANVYRSKWHVPSRVMHHVTYLLPVAPLVVFLYYILTRLQESARPRETLRPVILTLTLVLAFYLCWSPYNIVLIVDTQRGRSKTPGAERTTLLATLALACVHACLRPIIYVALCGKFQEKALGVVRCRKEECKGELGELWELGVGTERRPDQSIDPEEMKQMNDNVEQQQQQAGQC